jgi:large subunit ribosomal protein L4
MPRPATIELADAVFGAAVRKDILARWCTGSWPSAAPATHKTKGISEIHGTTKKPYKQKGTGRARQGSLRSPQFRGGARIFGPVVREPRLRPAEEGPQAGLRTALSSKAGRRQADGARQRLKLTEPKTKALAKRLRTSSAGQSALVIDGPEADVELRPRRPQHPGHRRAAAAGRQRLRHPAPRHAGADPRRRGASGGAAEMSAQS